MNSIYKITAWTVIIVSVCLIFIYLFALFTVGAAGHNTVSTLEICLFLLYLISLPISLYSYLSQNPKSTLKKSFSILLILVGIVFCLKDFYENSIKDFGSTEYLIAGIPLALLIITLTGLIKKRL